MPNQLAVVPIFMSAGAAVLPTILAAAGSVVALLLRPRELFALCRQRPAAFLGTLIGLIAVIGLTTWTFTAKPARAIARSGAVQASHYDWAQVAQDILARQHLPQPPIVSSNPPPTPVPSVPAPTTVPSGSTWIEGGSAARNSYSSGISPVGLTPFWRFRPEETMFLSQPILSHGRVYAAACQADLGSYTGLLACVDATTGKPIWQITDIKGEVLKPFFSSPALTADGKNLLIGQGMHQDTNCSLLCFDTETGKLRWAAKTPLHIESSPAIFGDLAVVGAGAIEGRDGKPTGNPGFVMGVRISDGKELWRQSVNDPESSPAIDPDGIIYIGSGFNGKAIVALRSQTDEELQQKNQTRIIWQTPAADPVTSPITLIDDLVISGSGNGDAVHSAANAHGAVVALDRATGTVRWQTAFDDSVLAAVAAHEGVLICTVRTGEVAALAAKDGSILWKTSLSTSAPMLAAAAFTGTHVYAVCSDGVLAILDASNGKVIEKVRLNDPAQPGLMLSMGQPQVTDGKVLVGSETGGLWYLTGAGTK